MFVETHTTILTSVLVFAGNRYQSVFHSCCNCCCHAIVLSIVTVITVDTPLSYFPCTLSLSSMSPSLLVVELMLSLLSLICHYFPPVISLSVLLSATSLVMLRSSRQQHQLSSLDGDRFCNWSSTNPLSQTLGRGVCVCVCGQLQSTFVLCTDKHIIVIT